MIQTKYNSEYQAIIDATRLSGLSDDKNFLSVYESSNAQIFPYQIMAARFTLRSDYLKGCILCDEASLGKTYEALLVVCQKWFEGNENILIILPANLLTQWFRKLEKDFPTVPYVFGNNTKTIPDETGLVITSYDNAIRYAERIKERDWDIVVFDEADVLSKSENKSVQILKEMAGHAFKLLLTPTPITKSIMDIYWLIWFIDESVFPDSDWFYKRYFRRPDNYHELTNWVSQFCFRTLKCQTTDYVNFTRRIPITINYQLSKEEKDLYKLVSAYIISDDKVAKGLDLEFCPVIVNYDLPYDSIKIEQRICRCHRQGQNSDVLVINMLSRENFADVRI